MKTLTVPRKSLRESAASLPALLLLGALSGSALAATDIESPCPEVCNESDVLHSFIARDAAGITLAVDSSESISSKPLADNTLDTSSTADPDDAPVTEDTDKEKAANPELTSSLPGVSVNDLPGFRRHMYRTDI